MTATIWSTASGYRRPDRHVENGADHLDVLLPVNSQPFGRFGALDAREKIQKLLITGDNRLKQGVAAEKVRATYEEALALAREAGLEERIRPLVEIRLADLERLASEH